MRWNDSATGLAAADQMLTMPVANCSVVVASRMGSTHSSSAGGEPPTQTDPKPRASLSLAFAGARPRANEPNRASLGLVAAVSVMVGPTGRVMGSIPPVLHQARDPPSPRRAAFPAAAHR